MLDFLAEKTMCKSLAYCSHGCGSSIEQHNVVSALHNVSGTAVDTLLVGAKMDYAPC